MADQAKPHKHSAIWWKSPVTIAGGVIEPNRRSVAAYDPFDYYFPTGFEVTGGQSARASGKISLPYLFVNVDVTDESEIASFCEQFGMLGAQFQVRSYETARADAKVSYENRDLWGYFFSQPKDTQVKHLDILRQSIETSNPAMDLSSVTEFVESQRNLKYVVDVINTRKANLPHYRKLLEYVFSLKLGMARPQLTLDERSSEWLTRWNIGSLETAMYLMLMLDLQGTGTITKCVGCPRYFLRDNPRIKYCSVSCQEVRKVARSKRLKRFSEHCGIAPDQARKLLKSLDIDYSRPFDFETVNRRRQNNGTKKRS